VGEKKNQNPVATNTRPGHVLDHTEYRVKPGSRVRMSDLDPASTGPFSSKEEGLEAMKEDVRMLAASQELLFASDSYSLLLVFQAMDAAGKDGAIEHVMSGVNPQGCQVFSFKQPSTEELDHNFLWRYSKGTPERGRIGIFNRSYYEEVLVVRVHQEWLRKQRIPGITEPKEEVWQNRYEDINAFERHLYRNGTVILKFFLNISRDEQRKRFLDRLNDKKYWKFSVNDLKERQYWDSYMKCYEEALTATSTDYAPWYVIPANRKWFARACIADIISGAIESLDLKCPEPTPDEIKAYEEAQRLLEAEGV
jgi:PPK2 family polyphosphate:nucleotide phosphotransferase